MEKDFESEEVKVSSSVTNYFPALSGSRTIDSFERLNKIEEGTYGVVYRAKDLSNGDIVALKRLKMENEREGFPITSIREINTLMTCKHENVVDLREIIVGHNMDRVYIVMEYVEHDLKSLMDDMSQPFLLGEVKTLFIQLVRGVEHLHNNWVLHRDLKTSNLLLNNNGVLKIGDFGLAREYGSPIKPYTPIVVTLWYRAPEVLLESKEYSTAIDMWSCGCILGELLINKPMFPGKNEMETINIIFKELGTPNDKIWPGPPAFSELPLIKKVKFGVHLYNNLRARFGTILTDSGFNLLNKLLTYDPRKRITATEVLQNEFFDEAPFPTPRKYFPTWPARHEGRKRPKSGLQTPQAPQGGQNNMEDKSERSPIFTMAKGGEMKGAGFTLRF